MVRATQRELAALGLDDPDVVLADAGYWHQRQMQQIASEGIQVLVPPDAGLRKGSRPGWNGGMYSFMRRALATPQGQDLYRQRQITIEPVFGQIKFTVPSSITAARGVRPPAGFTRQPRLVATATVVCLIRSRARTRRRRTYAPEATGPAQWRVCCSSVPRAGEGLPWAPASVR